MHLRLPLGKLPDRVAVVEAPHDVLVANRAGRAALEGVEDEYLNPHLARRLAQHLPQLTTPQHPDHRVGDAAHRREPAALALPVRNTTRASYTHARARTGASPSNRREFGKEGAPTHPSGRAAAGFMETEARARSESGGAEAGPPRGFHDARCGRRTPAEDEEAAVETGDRGELRSLACMLAPGGGGPVAARVQAGV